MAGSGGHGRAWSSPHDVDRALGGTTVRLTPLAAVDLFFDPKTIVEAVSRPVLKTRDARSLAEAEQILLDMGVLPETRLIDYVDYLK